MRTSFLTAFLFVGFPYLVLGLAIVVSILRFTYRPFTYSSLSSQFMENEQLFWGSNLWHWGILWVLLGHFMGFIMPKTLLWWNAQPLRLFILETTGLIAALLALFGLLALLLRRTTNARVKAVTSKMDIALLALLIIQVATGVCTALIYRWGSSWYAAAAVPYLMSVLSFAPKPELITTLPWLPKIHILSGFLMIGMIPFTRLVHFLVVPIWYLWRKPQLVMWNFRNSTSGTRG